MAKILMKGNEAFGKAAIEAGCKYFFGYPITPQSELPEYLSRELPKIGGAFVQAESEVSAINMVYGGAGAGARVMTSSSSPGVALKQEGITYAVGAEVPCVVLNVMRGGQDLEVYNLHKLTTLCLQEVEEMETTELQYSHQLQFKKLLI